MSDDHWKVWAGKPGGKIQRAPELEVSLKATFERLNKMTLKEMFDSGAIVWGGRETDGHG